MSDVLQGILDAVTALTASVTSELSRSTAAIQALSAKIGAGSIDPVALQSEADGIAQNLQGLKATLDAFDPTTITAAPTDPTAGSAPTDGSAPSAPSTDTAHTS